jgi:hypothetical protein
VRDVDLERKGISLSAKKGGAPHEANRPPAAQGGGKGSPPKGKPAEQFRNNPFADRFRK